MSIKTPLTPVGIEPATFRFVTQHLNHCATAVPDFHTHLNVYNVVVLTQYLCAFGGFSIIHIYVCSGTFSSIWLKSDSTYLEFLLVTYYILGTRNERKKAREKELMNIIAFIFFPKVVKIPTTKYPANHYPQNSSTNISCVRLY